MLGFGNGAAVFVPEAPQATRTAYSETLLEMSTWIRARGEVTMRPRESRGECNVLSGSITLCGPHASIRFRPAPESESGAPGAVVEKTIPLAPTHPWMDVPEFTVASRNGPPPFLWLVFIDTWGEALSRIYCLRPCGRMPVRIEALFESPARLRAWVSAKDVNERHGPTLGLSGELHMPFGIFLRISMAESCSQLGGPVGHVEDTMRCVVPAGAALPMPNRFITPGVGGMPWVSVALRKGPGASAEKEIPVGRCARMR
ncbi:MAG: hypothetical protein HYR74_12215 [Candidatus Eisenbacteria bacterium]|nr:hypothetical protein [Candidatus Eisenbacteria bacterium]